MDNIIFSKIDETNIEGCFSLNQDNVPEVGSTSIEEFNNLVQNSDFNLCATFEEKIVGFLICFQDTSKTKSFMYKIKHKNFNDCLLYTSPSPRDGLLSRMPSSA